MSCGVLHTGRNVNGSSAEYHADANWCGQWMVMREWGLPCRGWELVEVDRNTEKSGTATEATCLTF